MGLPLPKVPADVGRPLPGPGLLEEEGRPNDEDVEGRAPDPPRGSLGPEGRAEPTRPPWGRLAGTVLKALKPAGPGRPLWPRKGWSGRSSSMKSSSGREWGPFESVAEVKPLVVTEATSGAGRGR